MHALDATDVRKHLRAVQALRSLPLRVRDLRERTQRDQRQLQQRLGVTAMFVRHDRGKALILFHRIAVMPDGEIVPLGSPHEICEHSESVVAI